MSKTESINLKVKVQKKDQKAKERKFPLKQANELLSLVNSAWELADKDWKWNGTELAKNTKA